MKGVNKTAAGISVDRAATNAGKAKVGHMFQAVRQHVERGGRTRPEVVRGRLIEESMGKFCF